MNKSKLEEGVKLILEGLDVDTTDHNFFDTPRRYADALEEIFACPKTVHTTFDENYTDFVLVRGHVLWTLCPHHLLPVRMCVSVAYVPEGKVLGLSKLVRIMQQANSGPVMQERFTYAVRERLEKALETYDLTQVPEKPEGGTYREDGYQPNQKGICVYVEGSHGCMQMRGVHSDATAITMATSGVFNDDHKMLDRFLLLVGGRRG